MLPAHHRRRGADREHGAEIVNVELPLQIFTPDLRQPREAGGLARRVEQTIQSAELQHGAPEQIGQAVVVGNVDLDGDGAAGPRRGRLDLRHGGVRGAQVHVRHHHVSAFPGEAPRGGSADPAAAADHQDDVAGNEQRRPLPRVLFVDLAPFERPVLEREHLRLGNELESVDRLGVRDRLEHGPVAQIGRHRAPLVPERRDHPQPRYEHDLGPIVERALLAGGVAPVILLVVRPLFRDLGAHRVDQLIRRRSGVELEPERKTAGPQDVLRRRHSAPHERRQALRCESGEDVVGVVAMQDHPTSLPRPEGAAHDRQDELRTAPTRLRCRHRASRRPQHRPAAPARLEVVLDPVHDAQQARVALPRVLSPHH